MDEISALASHICFISQSQTTAFLKNYSVFKVYAIYHQKN